MLCSTVIVEWSGFFESVCICCMLYVMYGRRLFSRVLAITESNEMEQYEVPMFMYLLVFCMGIMFEV